jgi:hypothetical protein
MFVVVATESFFAIVPMLEGVEKGGVGSLLWFELVKLVGRVWRGRNRRANGPGLNSLSNVRALYKR